jgi:hypothetical protein
MAKKYYRKKKKSNLDLILGVIASIFALAFIGSYPVFSFILIGLLVSFTVFSKTNYGRGYLGELEVRMIIGGNKPNKNRYVINNITFHDGDKSAQIDHMIIDRSGIILIETKNRTGKIFGKEQDLNWTVVFSYGKKRATMFNPIKQNLGHVNSVKKIIGNDVPIHSLIVFSKKADIREISSQTTPVIYANSIKQYLKDYSLNDKAISEEKVVELYERFKNLKENNKITNKEHVAGINQRIEQRRKDNV